MRIKRIQIEKLFGMFDHDIRFNTSDRITIIHGPNGLGKTTVLRIMSELFSIRFRYFQNLAFDTITLTFGDRRRLRLKKKFINPRRSRTRKRPVEKRHGDADILFGLYNGRKKAQAWTFSSRETFPELGPHAEGSFRHSLRMIAEFIPWLERVGSARWLDRRSGEMMSSEDVFLQYSEHLPFHMGRQRPKKRPVWLENLLNCISPHFIETQRLFSYPSDEDPSHRGGRRLATVERYSEDMAERIQEKLRESGSLSASLDRTFPHRLLQERLPKATDDQRIREKYKTQSEYRNRLMQAGLIEPEKPVTLPKNKLEKADIRVLWHYMSDVDKRLGVFDALLQKAELFKDIINTRFLYKSFTLDKAHGFVFTNDKDVVLRPTSLSSGEQHELVLAYQLIFKVQPKALILIDEPELSLHVTWQHMFLDDLMRISKLVDLDFVIATHSPSIVHKRTDLMIPLEGPKG